MSATEYTFLTSFIWSCLFFLAGVFLKCKKGFVLKYGVGPTLALMCAAVLRLLLPFEPDFVVIINSWKILRRVQIVLEYELFSLGGWSVTVLVLLIAVWIAGVLFCLLRLGLRLCGLKRFAANLEPLPDQRARSILNHMVESSGTGLSCGLVVSEAVSVPMMTGFFRPVILLPALDLEDEALALVLRHEWNHYLHRDLWVKLLMNIFTAVFWWNPLAYLLTRDLDHFLEVRCDSSVVRDFEERGRVEYAQVTADMIRRLTVPEELPLGSAGFATAAGAGGVVQRCHLILYPPKGMEKWLSRLLAVLLVLVFLGSFMFVIQPAGNPPPIEGEVFLTPENSYLVLNDEGNYDLYYEGEYVGVIPAEEIDDKPNCDLPVIYEVQ